MCVIAKIEEIQVALMSYEFPKSGYNKYTKRKYHELKDIMPPIVNECHKRELVLLFNFTKEEAILDVTNKHDVKDYYRFVLPMPEQAALNKQMNIVQSIGADSTYLKRYLLVNSFLVLEDDVADALEPEPVVEPEAPKSEEPIIKEKSVKPKTPSIINEALIDLDKKDVPITRASLFSKCKQLGLDVNNRNEVIDWIEKNIKEDSK